MICRAGNLPETIGFAGCPGSQTGYIVTGRELIGIDILIQVDFLGEFQCRSFPVLGVVLSIRDQCFKRCNQRCIPCDSSDFVLPVPEVLFGFSVGYISIFTVNL